MADQRKQLDLLGRLNQLQVSRAGGDPQLEATIQSAEIAYRMQTEAPDVFDIAKEPEAVRARYGDGNFGRGCLMARRLVERGVRMVQVYYGDGQPWDNHDDIELHRKHAAASDGPIAALLEDLKASGLLKDTLVIIGGEFGRTPVVEVSGLSESSERPRSQQSRLLDDPGRRRRERRNCLRRDRRLRLQSDRQARPSARPARHRFTPAWLRSHQADLPLQRPRFPPNRRRRRSRARRDRLIK